jgi:hypothetical protein
MPRANLVADRTGTYPKRIPALKGPRMMSVIALRVSDPYLGRMVAALLKILTVMALAFMPLGMAPAIASSGDHPAAVQIGASPCEEHRGSGDLHSDPAMHCTACTALPALASPPPVADLRPEPRIHIRSTYFVAGFEPEVVTPPPKIS